MGVDELYLCPFCADLVEKGPGADDSTAIAHHPTHGALITSSRNCVLCACLCSLLTEPSSEGEPWEERALEVVAQHSGQSSLDVSWGEYEVYARSLVKPTFIEAKFTLATRLSKGEKSISIRCTGLRCPGYSSPEHDNELMVADDVYRLSRTNPQPVCMGRLPDDMGRKASDDREVVAGLP